MESRTIADTIRTDFRYDADKNLTYMKMVDMTAQGKKLVWEEYPAYDHNGNMVEKRNLEGTTRYAYDVNNQLVEVSYPGAGGLLSEKFGYDRAGNRLTRERHTVDRIIMETYCHDNCNRIKELNRRTYEPDGVTPKLKKSPAVSNNSDAVASYIGETSYYSYDRSGNLLSDGNATYTYDGFGRTTEVGMANGNSQINRYDAEGLRAEMEENGQLVKFLFNEGKEVIVEETDGEVIRYIRGLGIISSDSESARTYYYYVSDNQGSVRLILTDTVNDRRIRNYYCYDAFGESIISHEDVRNRFRFNGEQYDPVTSQYYLRARFYNPVIGRFTQEDTYYGDGLNLYEYCRNNPTFYRDLSGYGVVLICPGMQNLYNGTDFVVASGGVVYKIEDFVNMSCFDNYATLYHYTTEKGLQGILNSEKLNPSIRTLTTKDARMGSGQYLTDIVPGSKTLGQISRTLFGTPWNIRKVSYYIEIDISQLNVLKGRDGVYYIPNENILDLTNRIVNFGKTGE